MANVNIYVGSQLMELLEDPARGNSRDTATVRVALRPDALDLDFVAFFGGYGSGVPKRVHGSTVYLVMEDVMLERVRIDCESLQRVITAAALSNEPVTDAEVAAAGEDLSEAPADDAPDLPWYQPASDDEEPATGSGRGTTSGAGLSSSTIGIVLGAGALALLLFAPSK